MTKINLKGVREQDEKPVEILEVIEISDNGELIGWCQVLRELGLLQCPGRVCQTCWCG